MVNSMTQSIKNYLDMENIHSAIMLTGEWGCGKSYYVRNDLENELDELYKQNTENPKEIKVICISLYGLDKTEDINNSVRKHYLSDLGNTILDINKEKENKPATIKLLKNSLSGIATFLPQFGVKVAKGVFKNISGSIIELLQATEITPEINGKQVLLVFDDLERSTIDIQVLMGVINECAENNKVKVLVVANEDEIKKNKGKNEEYVKQKEKFIFQTISFNVELKEQLKQVIKEMYEKNTEYSIFLSRFCEKFLFWDDRLKMQNLRSFVYATELYLPIWESITKEKTPNLYEYQEQLFCDFYLNCLLFKDNELKSPEEEENEDLDTILSRHGIVYSTNTLLHYIPVALLKYIKTMEYSEEEIKFSLNDFDKDILRYTVGGTLYPIFNVGYWDFTNEEWENAVNALDKEISEDKFVLKQYVDLLVNMAINEEYQYKLNFGANITTKLIKEKVDNLLKTDVGIKDLINIKFGGTLSRFSLPKDTEYKKLIERILKYEPTQTIELSPEDTIDKIFNKVTENRYTEEDLKEVIDAYFKIEKIDYDTQQKINQKFRHSSFNPQKDYTQVLIDINTALSYFQEKNQETEGTATYAKNIWLKNLLEDLQKRIEEYGKA